MGIEVTLFSFQYPKLEFLNNSSWLYVSYVFEQRLLSNNGLLTLSSNCSFACSFPIWLMLKHKKICGLSKKERKKENKSATKVTAKFLSFLMLIWVQSRLDLPVSLRLVSWKAELWTPMTYATVGQE